jgi:DNA mismatch repair protein MSH2
VLFQQGKRIEIWAGGTKGRSNWQIVKQASPGNLQDVEEDFAGQIESAPISLAVKISAKGDERTVGVCFADASVRELGVSEFADNDLYSNFEVSLHYYARKSFANVAPVTDYPAWSERMRGTTRR